MKPNLEYTGDGRFTVGIPATELSEAELTAIAHKRGKTEAQLRKELIDSGLYAEKAKGKES